MDSEKPTVLQVPRDLSERRSLLANRPVAWEYLLFASVLLEGLARVEPKWRDYHLGYSMRIGPQVAARELPLLVQDRMSQAQAIVGNMMRVIGPTAQEAAFGAPGEPGDAALIEHMASRLVQMYEQLLDWADDLLSLRVPEAARRAVELCVKFVEQPVSEFRVFVPKCAADLEAALTTIAAGTGEQVHITMQLTFTVPDELPGEFKKELERAIEQA
ncbi:MAG: hypothetical protein FWD85_05035 [Microbacteriaceae bacterium]|nr:hypothetical protein [Microbacteriaceae bacterium]